MITSSVIVIFYLENKHIYPRCEGLALDGVLA